MEVEERKRVAVEEALRRSALLAGRPVWAEIRNGAAVLCGSVAFRVEREEAERLARSVPGVGAVRNEIRVVGPVRVMF